MKRKIQFKAYVKSAALVAALLASTALGLSVPEVIGTINAIIDLVDRSDAEGAQNAELAL